MKKFLDGIVRHKDYCENCKYTERIVSRFVTRGIINDTIAILFVFNEARPCRSRVVREILDNRVTQPETVRQIALATIAYNKLER